MSRLQSFVTHLFCPNQLSALTADSIDGCSMEFKSRLHSCFDLSEGERERVRKASERASESLGEQGEEREKREQRENEQRERKEREERVKRERGKGKGGENESVMHKNSQHRPS